MLRSCSLATLVLVSSFHAATGEAAEQPMDADAREIASYRLTTGALAKVVNVNRSLVRQMSQDPVMREALKVQAEISALERNEAPTEADEKRLQELRSRQDQLEDSIENPLAGDAKTLSEMEARIRKYPPLLHALKAEGMPPRDYAKFWLAFIQAAFAQGFRKSGMLKELPRGVSPENVKFIEDHAEEIAALQKELDALGREK
jgi:hypothetical protein